MNIYRAILGAAAVLALYVITYDVPRPAWASIGASICGVVIGIVASAEWRARRDEKIHRELWARFGHALPAMRKSLTPPFSLRERIGASINTERTLCDAAQEAHPAILSAKTMTIEPGVVDIVVTVAWWAWPAFMRWRVCRAVERAIEPQMPAGVQMRVRVERRS